MPTPEQLREWHSAFSAIERVDDYRKLKEHFHSVCAQIDRLNEEIPLFKRPTNPRQDVQQWQEKHNLSMLIKQKSRLEKQLSLMEEQIKIEIEASKKEL